MPRAVVLLSGGLDSATTLAEAIRNGFEAHALTVRYGQRHDVEIESAAAIARSLRAASHRLATVDLSFAGGSALTDPAIPVPKAGWETPAGPGIPPTYVPARNTVLLSLALAWAEALPARDLFIGANVVDYSGYPDCRPEFLEAFEALARVATKAGVEGEPFRIHAPLLEMTKGEIVLRAMALGVDLALTWSCYDPAPGRVPCGRCDACRIRAKGFRDAGIEDPVRRPRPA